MCVQDILKGHRGEVFLQNCPAGTGQVAALQKGAEFLDSQWERDEDSNEHFIWLQSLVQPKSKPHTRGKSQDSPSSQGWSSPRGRGRGSPQSGLLPDDSTLGSRRGPP